MTRRDLPPIFAKARFEMPRDDLPAVLFRVTPAMDDEAEGIVSRLDKQDIRSAHFVDLAHRHASMAGSGV